MSVKNLSLTQREDKILTNRIYDTHEKNTQNHLFIVVLAVPSMVPQR